MVAPHVTPTRPELHDHRDAMQVRMTRVEDMPGPMRTGLMNVIAVIVRMGRAHTTDGVQY